jgi:hypothetical protein
MQAAASKRLCVRRKTTDPVVDPPGDSQPPHAAPAPAAGSHCFSSTTTTSLSSSSLSPPPAVEEGWPSSWPSPSPPSPPSQLAEFAPRALPTPVAGQQRQQDLQEQEGLRSLLMMVVDQVREMRRENERLHDTIAQLRATQDEMRLEAEQRLRDTVAELLVGRRETKRRLKRVEQDQQQTRTEIERRLGRVEQDHQTIQRCELGQTGIELNHTCAPSLWSSLVVAAARPAIPPRLDSESSWCVDMPLVSTAAPAASPAAEVERLIAQTLPFLRAFDQSSLIIRDLQYALPPSTNFRVLVAYLPPLGRGVAWRGATNDLDQRRPFAVMHIKEFETLDDLVPIIVYASPSLCKLLGYDQVHTHVAHPTLTCPTHTRHAPDAYRGSDGCLCGIGQPIGRDARLPEDIVPPSGPGVSAKDSANSADAVAHAREPATLGDRRL